MLAVGAGRTIDRAARQFARRRHAFLGGDIANDFSEPAMQRQTRALRRVLGFLADISRKPIKLPVAQ
jgi:hypothetical protein